MYRPFRYAVILASLLTFGSLMNAEVRVTTPDALKAAVKKAPPEYPPMARQLKIGGRVEVDVVIDADGNVESVKVLSGNAMLTPGVVSAVKKWKFTPFTQEGAPSKAVAALDFDFKM
jgi:TonB family protein